MCEHDRKYKKYYHNDEHEHVNMTEICSWLSRIRSCSQILVKLIWSSSFGHVNIPPVSFDFLFKNSFVVYKRVFLRIEYQMGSVINSFSLSFNRFFMTFVQFNFNYLLFQSIKLYNQEIKIVIQLNRAW